MPVIFSDVHFHNWAACSKIENGINSRLLDTINATKEAFDYALTKDKIVLFAGDLVHTRGSLTPSVFNQIVKLWREYEQKGLEFYMIAGNHDSEDLNSESLRTAIDSLESSQCHVITQDSAGFELPYSNVSLWAYSWKEDLDELEAMLFRDNKHYKPNDIVMIHAPITGFVPHISKGLDPEKLMELNCRYVFAGHIHKFGCYKDKVYSIGSLTQQNFGDAGKKLGFLYLGKNGFVQQIETKAPHFLDLNSTKISNSPVFIKEVQNSFVRVTLENVSEEDKRKVEKELKALKPLNLDIRFAPKTVSARKEVLATSKLTSQEVTLKYIDKQKFNYIDETKQAALKILETVGQQKDE